MGKSCSIGAIFWFIILVSCGAGWLGWILFFTVTAASVAVILIKSYIEDKKNIEKNRDFFDWQEAEAERLEELYEKDPEAYKKEVQKFEEEFERRRNEL